MVEPGRRIQCLQRRRLDRESHVGLQARLHHQGLKLEVTLVQLKHVAARGTVHGDAELQPRARQRSRRELLSTPHSVRNVRAPVSGTTSMSPSAQLKASSTGDVKKHMNGQSLLEHGSPVPAIVARPAKKVVGGTGEKSRRRSRSTLVLSSEGANKGSGPHLIQRINNCAAPVAADARVLVSLRGLNGPCKTDGRIL